MTRKNKEIIITKDCFNYFKDFSVLELSLWGLVVAIIVKLEAHYFETASSFGHHRENNFVASHKPELITLTMCAKNKYVTLKKNKTT